MKHLLVTCMLLWLGMANAWALPGHKFTQYGSDEGLEEYVVQSIIQDHKGLMWFGTWNGLYSFDGYKFRLYKSNPDGTTINNTRLDHLQEAPDGILWMLNYEGTVYTFDPKTSIFTPINSSSFLVRTLKVMDDGIVWMITEQQELFVSQVDSLTGQLTCENLFTSRKFRNPSIVYSIHLDAHGRHWILTENGAFLYDPQSRQVRQVTDLPTTDVVFVGDVCFLGSRQGVLLTLDSNHDQVEQHQLEASSAIRQLRRMTDGRLVVATSFDGFFLLDPVTLTGSHITTDNCKELGNNRIQSVYVDKQGELWLRTGGVGVVHYVPRTGQCRRHVIHDSFGREVSDSRNEQIIVEDVFGHLWVHPRGGGLGWYNRTTDELEPFFNTQLQKGWNNANHLMSLFSDRQGNLWYCSFGNGLEKASFNSYPFHLESFDMERFGCASDNVSAIFQDHNGNIWAGCKDRVIRIYDHNYKFIGSLCLDGSVRRDRQEEIGEAYAFQQGPDGTLWIGTKGRGLIELHPSDPDSPSLRFKLTSYVSSDDDIYSLSSNDIFSLYLDAHGRLWVATFSNGVNIMVRHKGESRFFNTRNQLIHYPIANYSKARFVTGDSDGNIWIATTGGLLLSKEDFVFPRELQFRFFSHQSDNPTSLPHNDVMGICNTTDGRHFICSYGGGIYEAIIGADGGVTFHSVDQNHEAQLSSVYLSLFQDRSDRLWGVGEDALCNMDLKTGRWTVYHSHFFSSHFTFNEGVPSELQSGELIFSTVRGMLHFFPDSIPQSSFVPPIHFYRDSLYLPPKQHSFVANFAALDYVAPEYISYAYRLKGFEDEWHYIGSQHSATYTHLPAGTYELEVRSTDSNGNWVDNVTSIPVKSIAAFGETFGAVLINYLVIFIFMLFIFAVFYVAQRLRHRVLMEEQLTDMKLKFFTDVSHELRTPLTLITGPLEHILQHHDLEPGLREELGIVSNNASRMSSLVNQLLDFRKIQNGKMHLLVGQIDLIELVEARVHDFALLAESMHLQLQFEHSLSHLSVWADADKIDQVVSNLLSNAFKYSLSGQTVKVKVDTDKSRAVISVIDMGVGISKDHIHSLFERFGSGLNSTPSGMSSSGIGLSLVKELVELHHGQITVTSQPGVGSCFTVYLPLGNQHFGPDTEFVIAGTSQGLPVDNQPSPEMKNTDKRLILVVEDNEELRHFIRQIFCDEYVIAEASNGMEGVLLAQKLLPDLVISDVMMPVVDGFGLVKRMRELPELNHIPIILLTALADIDNQLQGIRSGIDDYITKPFCASLLKARVENLLDRRRMLQDYYQQRVSAMIAPSRSKEDTQVPETLLSAADQKFVDVVSQGIRDNLSNADYGVEDMAAAAHMSRSTYTKKLSAILGKSPSDLLRDARMHKAAELADQGELNMSEIAYEVGFNDPHYFGKCFKNYYGMTITEWKAR